MAAPLPASPRTPPPGAGGKATWQAHGADCGKVPTKQQASCGDQRHLLVARTGGIRDCALAPASADQLREQYDLGVSGDAGARRAPLAAAVRRAAAGDWLTVPRREQQAQRPPAAQRVRDRRRQLIEPVNGPLTDQVALDRHQAHSC